MAEQKLAGVLGYFPDPHSLIEGMHAVRKANYQHFDAFTPFPVHGLDDAQGLKRSWLPWITFIMGATGTAAASTLQYWTSAVDWPLIVGGKPFNSWPAFVPVMFELTVLFAGVSTFIGMIFMCGLPNVTKKTFDPALTRDRFAIVIEPPRTFNSYDLDESKGFKKFDPTEAKSFLEKTGASDVRLVYEEGWF